MSCPINPQENYPAPQKVLLRGLKAMRKGFAAQNSTQAVLDGYTVVKDYMALPEWTSFVEENLQDPSIAPKEILTANNLKESFKKTIKTNEKKWGLIPPAANDFMGNIYRLLPKGPEGVKQREFIEEKIIKPFARGHQAAKIYKQNLTDNWRKAKNTHNIKNSQLRELIPSIGMTNANAIRVYNWTKNPIDHHDILGLTDKQVEATKKYINGNKQLKDFADTLAAMTGREGGYTDLPINNAKGWKDGNLRRDLLVHAEGPVRAAYLKEFVDNKNILFDSENLELIGLHQKASLKKYIEEGLDRMEYGTIRKPIAQKEVRQMMEWINDSVGVTMFLNVRGGLLQGLSILNYMNWHDNNPLLMAKAMLNPQQFFEDIRFIYNSELLQTRRGGGSFDVSTEQLLDNIDGHDGNPLSTFFGAVRGGLGKGFILSTRMDSAAIAAGGATFYRNRINSLSKSGLLTKAEVEAQAWADFEARTEETQQSTRPDKISSQQDSHAGRIVFAFTNTPKQYTRRSQKAFSNIINKRGDQKENVSQFLYYGVAANAIFTTFQQALSTTDWDDEDDVDEKSARLINGVLDSTLRSFGYYGAAAAVTKNFITELLDDDADEADVLLALLSVSPPVQTKARQGVKVYKALHEDDYKPKIFDKENHFSSEMRLGVSGLALALNIPADRLLKKADHLLELSNGDLDFSQRLSLLLGWDKFSLLGEKAYKYSPDDLKEIKKNDPKRYEELKVEFKKRYREYTIQQAADKRKELTELKEKRARMKAAKKKKAAENK